MKPTRIWLGSLFLALGVFGVLDGIGVLAWDDSVGQWWPVAIVALGLVAMATDHRVTFRNAIITTFGVGLLASQQKWAGDGLIWALLLGAIGVGILFGAGGSPSSEHRPAEREDSLVASPQDTGPR